MTRPTRPVNDQQETVMKTTEARQSEEAVLNRDSTFTFACHENLPCFTQCCRDVNIYLTPYDVLRLRRALGTSSDEVLAEYTRSFPAGPAQIPIFHLLMDPDTLRCKLVTEDGCSVYENRPWACRMYPLDLAGRPGEYRRMVGRERCHGLGEKTSWNVGVWLRSQGIDAYAEMDSELQSVMPQDLKPGSSFGGGLGKLLLLAYDIDRFADMIQEDRFRSLYELADEVLQEALQNDEALLRLAFQYIREELRDLNQLG
jgi:hypothetical protein